MKQNFFPVVDEVAKFTGSGFEELNRPIESFGTGMATPVKAVGEQTGLMAPEHLDPFFKRVLTMKFEVTLTRQDDDSQSSPPTKCVGETDSLQTIQLRGSLNLAQARSVMTLGTSIVASPQMARR